MMKKPRAIYCAIAGVLALLGVADYFGLLGVSRTEQLDLIEMKFVTVDEQTGSAVTGVHARCFQSNNNNACSERNSGTPGTVTISIPVTKIVTKSFLFVQNITLRETVDPKLHIMFVHPDYANPVETFLVSELPAQSDHPPLTITMPKSLASKY